LLSQLSLDRKAAYKYLAGVIKSNSLNAHWQIKTQE
jgi:hypothetical protein